MKKTTGNAGAQPQPASIDNMHGATFIMESSADNKPLAISAGTFNTSNEKPEPEIESFQELEAGQKLHLPLILTLAGAAFLNASQVLGPKSHAFLLTI